MSAFNILSRETSCRLNILKVGEFAFEHSSPDHQAMRDVMVGGALLAGGFALAIHYSPPFRDFASKVVDLNKSTSEDLFHQEAHYQNGKSHVHVQPDADIPVHEPV